MIRLPGWFLLLLLGLLPVAGRDLHAAGNILLILDDLGHPIGEARLAECFELPAEVAFSIIPGTPLAARLAARCNQQDRDYLAHLPWEPLRSCQPGERLLTPLRAGVTSHRAVLEQVRRELPHMLGANNHQGSRASRDELFLERFAQAWLPLGLPFIDSRTIGDSRVARVLATAGIPVFENQLFLDHVDEEQAIRRELRNLETMARHRELTIAIIHPRPLTLRLMEAWAAGLPGDLRLVRAREILAPAQVHDMLAQDRPPTWPGISRQASVTGHETQED